MCFPKPKTPKSPEAALPPPTPEKVADQLADDPADANPTLAIRKGRSSLVIPRSNSVGGTSGSSGLSIN